MEIDDVKAFLEGNTKEDSGVDKLQQIIDRVQNGSGSMSDSEASDIESTMLSILRDHGMREAEGRAMAIKMMLTQGERENTLDTLRKIMNQIQ